MIQIYEYPDTRKTAILLQRTKLNKEHLSDLVQSVFSDVTKQGDNALRTYTKQFDSVEPDSFIISEEEYKSAGEQLPQSLKEAMILAMNNIESFHKSQLQQTKIIETMPGVECWQEQRSIEKVGIYIPGGSAPLFSTVFMLGIPAKIAGCKEIVLCTPPNAKGTIHPAIIYAAQLIGIDQIFAIGGIQAIAALSIGTESIPAVYKIFGPGNQYVTAAKQYAQLMGIAIDMPAGPSEVLVIADEFANAAYIASDLLAQAEHGKDSQAVLLTTSTSLAKLVAQEVNNQMKYLPRKEIIREALVNSFIIVKENLDQCFVTSNQYAPEHLILAIKNCYNYTENITNAGSVFLGEYSSESIGDYASGTNHTLPTNGFAKSYSGVSVDSFCKQITFQSVTEEGIRNIGPAVEELAGAEDLQAHKQAISIRLKDIM